MGTIEGRQSLAEKLREHQAKGESVVFANGCFDLLHVGHVRYLQGAAEEGDILVVAINSDRSVQQLKGPGRPVQDEADRAELIAALQCVDYVTVFEDPDVRGLLRELRPNVHAKGTDYTAETVPERDVAEEIGARVAIVGDPKDHATTDILGKIRQGD